MIVRFIGFFFFSVVTSLILTLFFFGMGGSAPFFHPQIAQNEPLPVAEELPAPAPAGPDPDRLLLENTLRILGQDVAFRLPEEKERLQEITLTEKTPPPYFLPTPPELIVKQPSEKPPLFIPLPPERVETQTHIAAHTPPPKETPPPAPSSCSYAFWPQLVTVRHIEGINDQEASYPLATNYSTLAIELAPHYCLGSCLPMIDLRGHRFDNTAYAANVGLVARYIPHFEDSFCKILGGNVYYDYRQACIGYFQQLGAGVEVLGERWDLRGNVYIPFGPKHHARSCLYDDYIGDYFYLEEIFESVSYAFDAEVGVYLYYGKEFSLYLAGGPYYIAGRKCMDKTRGGELRLRPQYRDYLSLDFSVQYDSLFKTVWQGEIALNLPLYTIKNQNLRPCHLTDWQIYQPVQRFEVMPVGMKRCYHSNF